MHALAPKSQKKTKRKDLFYHPFSKSVVSKDLLPLEMAFKKKLHSRN